MNRWALVIRLLTVSALLGAVSSSLLAAETLAVNQRFSTGEVTETPDFQRHVVPLLGRLGCNGRSCHGSFQGRGDFRLSLFGYDFEMDGKALHAAGSTVEGHRVDVSEPSSSLILQKPSLQIDHEGGERFKVDSWEYRLLQRWIDTGAKGTPNPRELSHLEVEPAEVVFDTAGIAEPVQLRVVAVWDDRTREDVTPLCRFRSNDDSVVKVDREGRLAPAGSGDTHVIAFYDNGVGSIPVMRPLDGEPSETIIDHDTTQIDGLVLEKLNKLRIVPSELCSDTEFLRRASLDLTGTLPTPAEVESFIADSAADKRIRKIDELLDRSAYAAWWTNKLCDFTGCNPNQQAELGQETSAQWYMWIYARLLANQPYDEIVRRIVLAQGRRKGQTYDEYAEDVSRYYREQEPTDFAERKTMPHYWTRRSMQKPEQAAEAFAHNFLGIRLQCAQCHKHPFAAWTQQDYQEFSRFFERIKFGVMPQDRERYLELAKGVGLQVRGDEGVAVRSDVLRRARKGGTVPWRELHVESGEGSTSLSLLRSGVVAIDKDTDPRLPVMEWMNDPQNPWFARALVNRVWASYFHAGIVDPPDDLNPANPPRNPKLLDSLSERFVQHDYDMKWLHREIVASDTYQRSWKPSRNNSEDRRNYSRSIPRRMPAEVVYDSVKQALAATDKADEVRTDLTRRASGHLSMRLAGTYAMQVFGKPDRAVNCDCERDNQPTLLQSVFLQNDPLIEQRLEQSGWLQQIAELTDPDVPQLVREAWLRTVSRPPTNAELTRGVTHVHSAESIVEGMCDLMWALLNTKEFILIK